VQLRSKILLAALDLIDQGFTLFDSGLKLVAWNRPFVKLLDFPENLMQFGTPFDAFIRCNAQRGEYGPGDVEHQVADRVAAARQFRSHYTERSRKNGQIIAIRGEPLPNLGFITLYTDITLRRNAERLIQQRNTDLEKRVRERTDELETAYQDLRATNHANEKIAEDLRRSEARLRLLTDAIPARIACIDRLGIYRFANRGYAEWLGGTKAQLIGKNVCDVIGPALYAEIGPHLERALGGEKTSFEYATQGKAGQGAGGTRYTYSEVVPEISAQGQVLGTFVLSTDITEQKRTQATLMQAQKMEAVGQLAGGIAHDLNNMLTVVLSNLSMLEERAKGTDDGNELVAPALLAVRRGATLIKRLLTFSRQHPLERRPVDLRPLVDGLVTMLRQTLPATIVLSLQMEEQLTFAMTDANQLENALLNLAFNARDAMPSGGALELKIERLSVSHDMASQWRVTAGNFVRITMTDNGCGMSEDTLQRACEPFYTTKGFGTGSGLGLSMVYGFAQQSGGTLTIQSTAGQGTAVSLLLPAIDSLLPEALQKRPAAQKLDGVKPLVLLVEDDPGVRRVICRQLVELGYSVVEAVDGCEALAMLKHIKEIGILVSDVIMPGGIDGPTLACSVRSMRPEVAILLISGSEYQYSESPKFKFLGKPFTKVELNQALVGLLV
jgi:PAS domain S-box-containing protein